MNPGFWWEIWGKEPTYLEDLGLDGSIMLK